MDIFDGWKNVMTGLGMKSRDKKMATELFLEVLSQREVEELYAGDDIAEKAVDVLVDDMFREGTEFKSEDQKVMEMLESEHDRLGVIDKIREAKRQARLYGGAAVILGIEDGQDASEPVKYQNIRRINYATVLNRHELPYQRVQNDPTKPNFGEPDQYMISSNERSGAIIHRSRMLIFHGSYLPRELYKSNGYWHQSVLVKVRQDIIGFSSAYHKIYSLLEDFDQGVYKIKDLGKLIASGKDQLVLKRLQMIDSKRSMIKSIVVDADGEDFERKTTSFQAVPDILDRIAGRIAGALKMPKTKLLSEGAAGTLGGGGESELKEWYDQVSREQRKVLNPEFRYLNMLIMAQLRGPFKGKQEDIDIAHRPLRKMSQKEKAELQKITAEADQININMGIYTADEAAISHFGGSEFSTDIKLSSEVDRGQELNEPNIEDETEQI